MFAIDFGALAVSWWVLERIYYRQYLYSNIIGDAIGLTLIAGFMMVILQRLPNQQIHAWYVSNWWYVGVLVAGILIIAGVTFNELRQDLFNWRQELSPSKAWHALAWPVFFWVLVAPAPAVIASGTPIWALIGALAGVLIWSVSLIADFSRNPPPLGGVVEFSWLAFFQTEHPSRVRTDQWGAQRKPLPWWFNMYYTPEGEAKQT
jgi:hypothetical protein